MSKAVDLTGKKFGRLTVIKRVENTKQNHAKWLCLCNCGNYTEVITSSLTKSNTKSCGCLHREVMQNKMFKHGQTRTKLYMIWRNIITRCTYRNYDYYKSYGGRGISICEDWLHDFKTFYDWAMSNGYEEGLSIDRIDVNGNYEPDNCRWVTIKEKENNRTNNHFLTYKGNTHTIAQWAEILGLKYSTLFERLRRNKWNVELSFEMKKGGCL